MRALNQEGNTEEVPVVDRYGRAQLHMGIMVLNYFIDVFEYPYRYEMIAGEEELTQQGPVQSLQRES